MLEFSSGGCDADYDFDSAMDVGQEVTFSGCEVKTLVNEESDLTRDQYTLMTLWQEVIFHFGSSRCMMLSLSK